MVRSLSVLLLVVPPMMTVVGCGSDPVTTPDGQPLVYTGIIEQGGRKEEPLLLAKEGTIRIELTKADPLLIELPGLGEALFFTLGVGIGDSTSGTCQITFGASLAEGENLTVLVEDTMRCLLIFDDGTLPPDAVVSYTIMVEDVKS